MLGRLGLCHHKAGVLTTSVLYLLRRGGKRMSVWIGRYSKLKPSTDITYPIVVLFIFHTMRRAFSIDRVEWPT